MPMFKDIYSILKKHIPNKTLIIQNHKKSCKMNKVYIFYKIIKDIQKAVRHLATNEAPEACARSGDKYTTSCLPPFSFVAVK